MGGLIVRHNFHKYRSKYKNIVGITLGIVGFIILISVMPFEALLALIGIALLVMGILLIRIK